MECVLVQTQCIIKQIFVDDNAGEYFKTIDKFIYEYGIPCFIENKNIQWFRNDITYLGEEVAKIINEFGISKIKTPKKCFQLTIDSIFFCIFISIQLFFFVEDLEAYQ